MKLKKETYIALLRSCKNVRWRMLLNMRGSVLNDISQKEKRYLDTMVFLALNDDVELFEMELDEEFVGSILLGMKAVIVHTKANSNPTENDIALSNMLQHSLETIMSDRGIDHVLTVINS